MEIHGGSRRSLFDRSNEQQSFAKIRGRVVSEKNVLPMSLLSIFHSI